MTAIPSTLVLVHGAGHTARVWETVRRHLSAPSVAVDLPGRRDRAGDLPAVTITESAAGIAADVTAATAARVVLVGHSVGGIVLPEVAARLDGRVDHLVFVAGLCAKDGDTVADTVSPGRSAQFTERLGELRARYAGHMLEPEGACAAAPAIHDPRVAMSIDSLNFMSQTVSWEGVDPGTPRTFVRCLRDRIQPRAMQARLAENCAAADVIDIDSGHTPALQAPAALAAILDGIASGSAARADERVV
ncbi:MAG TPA: alpha/beta hydrolase [Acidimicrobiia bacterium]|nr:alpha/beta hydrolase [Acidimicrobiia bacterium]